MKLAAPGTLLGITLLVFTSFALSADELTVNSILAAQQSGARSDGIIHMVDDPANTIAITDADIVRLRNEGVPEAVIDAIQTRVREQSASSGQLPDDSRLIALVRQIDSGISESDLADQIRQSGQVYQLSVNDLLYLKQHNTSSSTIAALTATRTPAPVVAETPRAEMSFSNLVLVKKTGMWRFFRGNRQGRLVLQGDTLRWEDNSNASENFTFQTSGLEKVWFTCEARSSGNFCYQINFQIVRGNTYRFRDTNKDTGSNAAVLEVMEALRTNFPRLTFGRPSVD